MVTVESDNKTCFFNYVNSKRSSKENIGLILGLDGHITSKEEKTVEAFNAFSPQFLRVMTDLGLPEP